MILVLCGIPGALRDRAVDDIRKMAHAERIAFEVVNYEYQPKLELRLQMLRRIVRKPRRYDQLQLVLGPTTEEELTQLRAQGAYVAHFHGPLPKLYDVITVTDQDLWLHVGDHPSMTDHLHTPPQALMECVHRLRQLRDAEANARRARA